MQQGQPQQVYDDPANLFVAQFLGTPPINVFEGVVRDCRLYLDGQPVLQVPGVADQRIWAGIRPEGFLPSVDGPLTCGLERVEVLGRDVSVVCTHSACTSGTVRAIVNAACQVDTTCAQVRFALRRDKVFLFHWETQQRVPYAQEEGQKPETAGEGDAI